MYVWAVWSSIARTSIAWLWGAPYDRKSCSHKVRMWKPLTLMCSFVNCCPMPKRGLCSKPIGVGAALEKAQVDATRANGVALQVTLLAGLVLDLWQIRAFHEK